MKVIYSRRSIRKYSSKEVGRDDVINVVKAGMNAPSAGDEQPWHFIIINDKNLLKRIMEVHPHSSMLAEAGWAVIVCCDLSLERHDGFWVQDCSAAVENMLLEAADTGLGSVWLGVYPRKDRGDGLKRIFSLPDSLVPFAVLPLGYPAEEKPANDKFDYSRIHFNSW